MCLHLHSAGHSRPGGVQRHEGAVHEDRRRLPHRLLGDGQGQLRARRPFPPTHTTGQRQVRRGQHKHPQQFLVTRMLEVKATRECAQSVKYRKSTSKPEARVRKRGSGSIRCQGIFNEVRLTVSLQNLTAVSTLFNCLTVTLKDCLPA